LKHALCGKRTTQNAAFNIVKQKDFEGIQWVKMTGFAYARSAGAIFGGFGNGAPAWGILSRKQGLSVVRTGAGISG
jgi:hypothetical protein